MVESKNNKGFSLVELVIVIAIMAVLVAVLAPLYLKYVERSKITTDSEIASAVQEAVAVAIADENIAERPLSGFSPNPQIKLEQIEDPAYAGRNYPEFVASIKSFLQADDLSTIKSGLKSKQYKGQDILVEINGTNQSVTVTVPARSSVSSDDLVIY